MKINRAKLSKEVLNILKENTNVYSQSSSLEKHLEKSNAINIYEIFCLVNLELACAKVTEFEEDIIDFGNNAIIWLNKALLIEPNNTEVKSEIITIQKKIRKAEKSVRAILDYEKENLDDMPNIDYVKELAFYYYSRCERSITFASKGYKCYKYIYEKELDKNSTNSLYLWHALTECKYVAQGYNSAIIEIEKLIMWELKPDDLSYSSFVTDGYWMKLHHCCETNDIDAFQKLYSEWYNKMIPIEMEFCARLIPPVEDNKPHITKLNIINPITKWLLQNKNTDLQLKYILENGYLVLSKNLLGNEEKEIIQVVQKRLKS